MTTRGLTQTPNFSWAELNTANKVHEKFNFSPGAAGNFGFGATLIQTLISSEVEANDVFYVSTLDFRLYRLVSRSCAVAKSEIFWRPQQKFGFHIHTTALWPVKTVFHSVCQVWLSSGPPESFTFSYCAWLWNWLIWFDWIKLDVWINRRVVRHSCVDATGKVWWSNEPSRPLLCFCFTSGDVIRVFKHFNIWSP